MQHRFSYSQREFEVVPLSRWACGPTSLLNCMRLLGNTGVTFADVLDAAGSTRWKQEVGNIGDFLGKLVRLRPDLAGMDEDVFAAAARRLGYRAVVYSGRARDGVAAWARLVAWGAAREPAAISVGNGGHWMVVFGATARGAWVFDPNFSVASDEPVRFWPRTRLLRRWWNTNAGDLTYYAIRLAPRTAATRAMQRRGQVPPGKLAFQEVNEGNEQGLLTLRADLGAIVDALPGGARRVVAADVFAGIGGMIRTSVVRWSCDADARWLRVRVALVEELLRGLALRVSARAVAQLSLDGAILCTADALIAAEVTPGEVEPEHILAYDADAAAVFGGATRGTPASVFLAAHEDLLVARLSQWLGVGSPRTHRRHVRRLAAACAGERRSIPVGHEHAALIEIAVLLVIYAWYPA